MNKARRAEIAKANNLMNDAHAILEECLGDEQDYYDNMPESLQNGEKGAAARQAIDTLTTATEALEEIDLLDI